MKKLINRSSLFVILILLILSLSSCSSSADPADTVSLYWSSLAAKDSAALTQLSCADWEKNSTQLLDAFVGVETRLEDLECMVKENSGDKAKVSCTGKLVASYNGEDQELDLSTTTFLLIMEKNDWLVCGQE